MKKALHIITFVFLLFATAAGLAKTITVCNSCSVKTIQEGINQASEGDTVFVKKGVYKEFNIILDKSITLLGENLPTIDGEDKGEIIKIVSDNVTIDGF